MKTCKGGIVKTPETVHICSRCRWGKLIQ